MSPDDVNLGLHIGAGSVVLVLGPIALLMAKRRPGHPRAGDAYHWLFVSSS